MLHADSDAVVPVANDHALVGAIPDTRLVVLDSVVTVPGRRHGSKPQPR